MVRKEGEVFKGDSFPLLYTVFVLVNFLTAPLIMKLTHEYLLNAWIVVGSEVMGYLQKSAKGHLYNCVRVGQQY